MKIRLFLILLFLGSNIALRAQVVLAMDFESSDLNFAVISDTHVGNTDRWEVKINRAIDQLLAQKKKLDAVFITGDVTDGGEPTELANAKSIFSRLEAVVPVYYLMGNHDWYFKNTPDDSNNSATNFIKAFNQPLSQYIKIKGYPFITIGMESSSQPNAYATTSQSFLKSKLAQAAADFPGKPIFLFVHVPVAGTVYGSYKIGGDDNWGTIGLKAICEQYPQLVVFSGHSHYPLGDERSIHQDKFTSINVGSLSYAEMETGLSTTYHPPNNTQITEGCLVAVNGIGDIKVKRWDFTRNEEIRFPWLIKSPVTTANLAYAGRTGGTAPYFSKGDKPTVTSVTDSRCIVTFPQAKDDEGVHHYLVEVVNEKHQVLSTAKYTVFSGFYLNSEIPKTISWNVLGLKPNTKYTIRVYAIDSYSNISLQPISSKKFKTRRHKVASSTVPAVADLLALSFKPDGNTYDLSVKKLTITTGSEKPTIAYDKLIKQYVSVFKGFSKQYFKIDYQNDTAFKQTLENAFTLETYLKISGKGMMSPVSSLETGGFGIEEAREGELKFWFRKNAVAYETLNIGKLDTGRYHHVVFTWDNRSKLLTGYVNGLLVNEKKLLNRESLVFSQNPVAQWLGIGGDANLQDVESPFFGSIAAIKLYGNAISNSQVALAYQQVKSRLSINNIDELRAALTTITPKKIKTNPLKTKVLSDLLEKGWFLMGNITTTQNEIVAYLFDLNQH